MTEKKWTVILGGWIEWTPDDHALEEKLLMDVATRARMVLMTPPLYDVRDDGPVTERLRSIPDSLIVVDTISPRAMYWRLAACGITGRFAASPEVATSDDGRVIYCIEAHKDDSHIDLLDRIAAIVGQGENPETTASNSGVVEAFSEEINQRWYPVVDTDRCVNCLECLNFCLFGVYGLGEGERLFVEQPDACRDGCPACARVCPTGAIIFARCPDPVVAGREQSVGTSALQSPQSPPATTPPESPPGSASSRPEESTGGWNHLVDEIDDMDL